MAENKAGFKEWAELRHVGGKNFILLNDLHFWSEKYGRLFIAPAGIETDLASIPQWAQSFVGVLGNNIRSAILHDFHCLPEGKIANQVSQKMADDLFREGLAIDEEPWAKARVMFRAVTTWQRLKFAFSTTGYSDIPPA